MFVLAAGTKMAESVHCKVVAHRYLALVCLNRYHEGVGMLKQKRRDFDVNLPAGHEWSVVLSGEGMLGRGFEFLNFAQVV